jgi:hypothetical protein
VIYINIKKKKEINMRTWKKSVCMLMVLGMVLALGSELPAGVSSVSAASYTAEDVKNAADFLENYAEKAGDDVAAFLKEEGGYSSATVKEALQTLIIKYGSYKKLVLRYQERLGVDITKSLKKALGNLDAKGGKLSKMNVLSIEEQLYTGKAIKPVPIVMDGGYQLVKSKDYKITYADNKKIGKATITLKGIGKYSGEIKKTFSIVAVRKSDIPTVFLYTSEIVGDSTFLTWRVSSDDKSYDGVQLLRSDKLDGKYTVIKTIKGENTNAGYIDKNTKKKSYYYKVRAYVEAEGKKWSGNESYSMLAEIAENDWYSSTEGYVKAWKSDNDSIEFIEYDLSLDTKWNCDWPNTYGEEEITYTSGGDDAEESKSVAINYLLSTPYNYTENGQDVMVGVYYDKDKFYYIWTQSEIGGSGGKSGFMNSYTVIK